MDIIVIATHAQMAKGIKETVEYIMGKQSNLFAIPAYTSGFESVKESLEEIIAQYRHRNVFVLTDLLGGSVNTEVSTLLSNYPQLRLIAGVNLPLVIQCLLTKNLQQPEILNQVIGDAKESITLINQGVPLKRFYDEF